MGRVVFVVLVAGTLRFTIRCPILYPVVDSDYTVIAVVNSIWVAAHKNTHDQVLTVFPATATNLCVCLNGRDGVLHELSTAAEDIYCNGGCDKGCVNYNQILLPTTPLMRVTLFYQWTPIKDEGVVPLLDKIQWDELTLEFLVAPPRCTTPCAKECRQRPKDRWQWQLDSVPARGEHESVQRQTQTCWSSTLPLGSSLRSPIYVYRLEASKGSVKGTTCEVNLDKMTRKKLTRIQVGCQKLGAFSFEILL